MPPPAMRPPPIPQAKSMISAGRGIKLRQPAPSSLEGAPSAPIGRAETPVGTSKIDVAVQKVAASIAEKATPAIKAVFSGNPITVPPVHEQLTAIAAGAQVTETNSQTGANGKSGAEPNNGTQPEAAVEGAPAPAGTRLRTAAEIASDGGSTVPRNETPTSPVAEDDFEAAIAGVHAEQVAAVQATVEPASTPPAPTPEPAPNQPETGEWQDPLSESDRNILNATLMELANKLIPEKEFNPLAFAETIIARTARGELGAIFSVGALQDLQKQGLLPNTDQMKAMITNLAASLSNGAQPLLERAVAQGILTQTEADGLLPQNPAEPTNYGEVTHALLTKRNKDIDPAKVNLAAGLVAQRRTLFEPESLLNLGIAETHPEAQQLANYFSTLPKDTRTTLDIMAHIGDSGIHNFMNILMLISMLSSLSGEQGQGH